MSSKSNQENGKHKRTLAPTGGMTGKFKLHPAVDYWDFYLKETKDLIK